MAAANYMTMENFPLFVKEFNTQIKRCPACGLYQDCENDVCEECGEELEEELFFDSIECQELVYNIESRLENDVNGGLTFHKFLWNLVIIPAFNSMWKPRMTRRKWTTRTAAIISTCIAA